MSIATVSLSLAIFMNFLNVGLLFGWSSIQAMLVDQNVYEFLCHQSPSNSTMLERDSRFALGITIGLNGMIGFRLPASLLFHKFGPKIVLILEIVADYHL